VAVTNRWTHAVIMSTFVFGAIAIATVATRGEEPWEAAAVLRSQAPYRRPATVPHPETNPPTPERELLGRMLFFDPRLSGPGTISCATCHNPGLSWSDGLPTAIGATSQRLARRTPTLLNLAWAPALFWDGRAESLEDQALGPILNANEMDMKSNDLIPRLQAIAGYRTLFDRAYPGEPMSEATVAKAIATFERRIVSAQAPFDRWIAGDAQAISPSARRGFTVFTGKARCSTCHSGWRFTDDGFYDIGVADTDTGRGKVLPAISSAQFAFKTPTLRNVARRAPYLHNGSAQSLEEVIDLYDRGGVARRPSLSSEIKPLSLTNIDKQDLIAFLESFTSRDAEARVPTLPR
jgi:cytochrome c peroxidase